MVDHSLLDLKSLVFDVWASDLNGNKVSRSVLIDICHCLIGWNAGSNVHFKFIFSVAVVVNATTIGDPLEATLPVPVAKKFFVQHIILHNVV